MALIGLRKMLYPTPALSPSYPFCLNRQSILQCLAADADVEILAYGREIVFLADSYVFVCGVAGRSGWRDRWPDKASLAC
jgi:hypothetical protein